MTTDIPLSSIKPVYPPTKIPCSSNSSHESPSIQSLILTLQLTPHPEGGYYNQTDRSPLRIANPYHYTNIERINKYSTANNNLTTDVKGEKSNKNEYNNDNDNDTTRFASTTIFYLLTPHSPLGAFHRNRSRTVHTLHRGRGRYVVIHIDRAAREDGEGKVKASIESFVVGQRVEMGERLQWCVEGGDYKASYLLPEDDSPGVKDGDGNEKQLQSGGLLISEVSCKRITVYYGLCSDIH